MGPGPLIAIDIILLYSLLGPLVLFGIYVFFDTLERTVEQKVTQKKKKQDPALWRAREFDISGLRGDTDRG